MGVQHILACECCVHLHTHIRTYLVREAEDGECIEEVLPCGWFTRARDKEWIGRGVKGGEGEQ